MSKQGVWRSRVIVSAPATLERFLIRDICCFQLTVLLAGSQFVHGSNMKVLETPGLKSSLAA